MLTTAESGRVVAESTQAHTVSNAGEYPTVKPLQEKVFAYTSPKPLETTSQFPNSFLNSQNNFQMFLQRDP